MKSRTRNFKQAGKNKNYCCVIQNLVLCNIYKKTAKEKFFPIPLFKKTANEIKVIFKICSFV